MRHSVYFTVSQYTHNFCFELNTHVTNEKRMCLKLVFLQRALLPTREKIEQSIDPKHVQKTVSHLCVNICNMSSLISFYKKTHFRTILAKNNGTTCNIYLKLFLSPPPSPLQCCYAAVFYASPN